MVGVLHVAQVGKRTSIGIWSSPVGLAFCVAKEVCEAVGDVKVVGEGEDL
jgi:hypothetical protein